VGTGRAVAPRVVFDTGVVVSALLFHQGQLAWLRQHWSTGECTPLISRNTAEELVRVLAYPRFGLTSGDRDELLGEHLVYCNQVSRVKCCPLQCRDPHDQVFLDLAHTAQTAALVTGDHDLLLLAGRTSFPIDAPAAYRERMDPG
jgi:uncharacterized protein